MGLFVATKAFFKLLFNQELSQTFQQWADSGGAPRIAQEKPPVAQAPSSSASVREPVKPAQSARESVKPLQPAKPTRSEAITLLAALQREARLIDIVKEPLDSFSDAQIGAAARDVLKNSGSVIERMFGLVPMTELSDGATLSTPAVLDPALYRLSGNVTGQPPFTGTVAHQGWKATRCDIPQWNGNAESALVLAPIEIEVQ